MKNMQKNSREGIRSPLLKRAISESLETRTMFAIPEPNNTFDSAYTPSDNIYLERSFTSNDAVSTTTDGDDYYKFYSLYGTSNLYAALYGLSADADLYVYNANKVSIGASTKLSNQSELVNVNIPANQYFYVRVHAAAGSTNYNLLLLNDYAGNTLGTARNQGVSWGQTNDRYQAYGQIFINDYMDYRDNQDIFKFQMEAAGNVSLRRLPTQDPGGGALVANLQLLDSGGSVIANVNSNGSSALNLDRFTLNKGTYYVRTTQTSGSGNYQLRITSDYAGDTTGTARDLGDVTNSAREDTDMVGSPFEVSYTDALDLYKIKLSKTAPLDLFTTMTMEPTIFRNDLYLAKDTNGNGFIDSGEIISTSANTGNNQLHFTSLTAGTYYVGVVQHGPYTTYTLSLDSDLDAPASATKAYANMSKAQSFGTITGMVNFDGGFGISTGDITDFTKFVMPVAGKVRVGAFNNPAWSRNNTTPFAAIIKDSNNNQVNDAGEIVASGTGGFTATLPAGTYYLELGGSGGTQAYYGSITPDFAGDSIPKARAMAAVTNNSTQSFSDYIEQKFDNSSDYEDFYSFALGATTNVNLKTTGVSGEDLSLSLIQDKNNNGLMDAGEFLAVSDAPNSPTESITKSLAAGKYFVRVHGVNGGTNYNLTATFGNVAVTDPDNTISKVSGLADHNLNNNSVINFSLNPKNDIDLFKFTATAGKTIKLDIDSRNGSSLDTYLRIFKSDGTQIAFNDNGAASGETLAKFSYLSYTFATAGTYYIGVSLAPNKNYNIVSGSGAVDGTAIGDYALIVS